MDGDITTDVVDGTVVFRFRGSIESAITQDLKQQIIDILKAEDSGAAIFDLSETSYIDSMGIGMFVHLHVLHRDRVKFQFCSLSPNVARTFGYVKLLSFFDIKDDIDAALEALRSC